MVSLSLSFSLKKSESQPHDDGCTTPGNHNRLVESLFDTAFTVELYINHGNETSLFAHVYGCEFYRSRAWNAEKARNKCLNGNFLNRSYCGPSRRVSRISGDKVRKLKDGTRQEAYFELFSCGSGPKLFFNSKDLRYF